jgi:hypothetical protein
MAFNRSMPLDERVRQIRAELDAFIDARVAAIKPGCPGIPDGVIRNLITRGSACQCAAYLDIKEKDDEQKARESGQETAA